MMTTDNRPFWPLPPAEPSFAEANAVHVWAVSLDLPRSRIERLASLLSGDERERAATFRGEVLQHRYIAGRGQVREILARYLACSASAVRFSYDANRKPALAPNHRGARLDFNISHSSRVGLLAISAGVRIGVDVEEMKAFDDMASVAAQFFSAAERRALALCPGPDRISAFYRCWTRKEAYLKAIGTGLLTPLDSFDVSLDVHAPRLLRAAHDAHAATRWSMCHLVPDARHVGALAVDVANPVVTCWSMPDGDAVDQDGDRLRDG